MRLIGIDIARFIAFCGMVLVNFRIVSGVAFGNDTASQITHQLEGRAAALFVVLAGVGLALSRPRPAGMVVRGVFLMAIGLINLVIFPADILHFYGVYFLCVIPFLNARPRKLLLVATAITAIAYVALFTLDYDAEWNWETLEYQRFWTLTGFTKHIFYNGWHPVFPWLAFLLIGMAIGRLNLFQYRTQLILVLGGSAVTPIVNAISDQLNTVVTGTTPIPPNPFYILSASASAAASIGVILLLTPILKRLRLAEFLASPGRQALTLYMAHIVIGMGIMDYFGWIGGGLNSEQIFNYSLGFIGLTVIYATLWKRIASRGPLESLLRLFTERSI